jgi:hypothetical protein
MLPRVFDLFTQVRHNLDRSHGGPELASRLRSSWSRCMGDQSPPKARGLAQAARSGCACRWRTLWRPRAAAAAEPSPPVSHQDAKLKVLVVDDNFDVAQTTGWMIEAIGHDYRMVHESKLAVQTAREYRPDAILRDINMPGHGRLCRLQSASRAAAL